jgi:hypothetical protein
MWLLPLSFTVTVKKTRTGWEATVRISIFI